MKKFGKALICLCLTCSFAFTGCSLVQRNTERYLNRTVATVGETTISKQDLITAYNNYGYQYVRYYGYTTERAVKTTLDGLIDNKILVEKAKEMIKVEDDGTVSYYDGTTKVATLFNKNVWNNEIWKEVFEGVNSQIASIEDDIRELKGIKKPESTTEEEPEFSPYDEYEKKVKYEDGVWSVIKSELEPAAETKVTIGDFVQNETGDAEISALAFKRYAKKLELNYKSKNLTMDDLKTVNQAEFDGLYSKAGLTNEQKIALLYEFERLYNAYEESKYTSTLQTIYEEYKQTINDDFNQKIVNHYKQMVEESYEKYNVETEADGYKAYVTAMQDDYSKVYYHKDFGTNDLGEKKAFVAVSHVLIKLSDEQIAEIKELQSKRDSGYITIEEYDDSYQKVLDKTVVHARDEKGFETNVTKTVAEVRAEIDADLSQYSTVEEKAVAFNKYIYKYGQDTGMINASHYYAVNLDTTVTDKMVKAFADESRRLAALEEDGGNLGDPVFVSQDNYSGFHIIFNAGVIKNDLTIEQVRNFDYKNASYLYNKKIMLGTNKTVYDYIYDTIYTSGYSNYRNSIISTAKQNLKVTYYVSAYEDLY